MARKNDGVNRSEAIREYLKANRDASPKQAAAELTKQLGVEISATYVSNIKSTSKGKRGRKAGGRATSAGGKPGPKVRMKAHVENNGLARNGDLVSALVGLKAAVAAVGGAEQAKRLIDILG